MISDIIAFTAVYHFDQLFSNKSNKKFAWIYFILDVSTMAFFSFDSTYQTQFWTVWGGGSQSLFAITGSHYLSLVLITPFLLWLFGVLFKFFYVFYKYPCIFSIYILSNLLFVSLESTNYFFIYLFLLLSIMSLFNIL